MAQVYRDGEAYEQIFIKGYNGGIWCVEETQDRSPEGEPGGAGGKESACTGRRPGAACHPTQCGRPVKGLDWESLHLYSNQASLRSFKQECHGKTGFRKIPLEAMWELNRSSRGWRSRGQLGQIVQTVKRPYVERERKQGFQR